MSSSARCLLLALEVGLLQVGGRGPALKTLIPERGKDVALETLKLAVLTLQA